MKHLKIRSVRLTAAVAFCALLWLTFVYSWSIAVSTSVLLAALYVREWQGRETSWRLSLLIAVGVAIPVSGCVDYFQELHYLGSHEEARRWMRIMWRLWVTDGLFAGILTAVPLRLAWDPAPLLEEEDAG